VDVRTFGKEKTMKRMSGGTKADPGFYWNASDWRIVTIEKEPHALPGGPGSSYVKVPAVGMLVLAPVLGLSFVMFLPFVGFALVARQVGRKAMRLAGVVGAKLWAEDAHVRPEKEAVAGRPAARKRA
jgi:hypothetical protein